ncbi:hypothetical protein C8R45DRAFT_918230 [Mycena sanguinolenta]|nr:hypothetical protein C8R45DRAFT_918230 [Mycena sanguinolenta]
MNNSPFRFFLLLFLHPVALCVLPMGYAAVVLFVHRKMQRRNLPRSDTSDSLNFGGVESRSFGSVLSAERPFAIFGGGIRAHASREFFHSLAYFRRDSLQASDLRLWLYETSPAPRLLHRPLRHLRAAQGQVKHGPSLEPPSLTALAASLKFKLGPDLCPDTSVSSSFVSLGPVKEQRNKYESFGWTLSALAAEAAMPCLLRQPEYMSSSSRAQNSSACQVVQHLTLCSRTASTAQFAGTTHRKKGATPLLGTIDRTKKLQGCLTAPALCVAGYRLAPRHLPYQSHIEQRIQGVRLAVGRRGRTSIDNRLRRTKHRLTQDIIDGEICEVQKI